MLVEVQKLKGAFRVLYLMERKNLSVMIQQIVRRTRQVLYFVLVKKGL